MPSIWRMCVIRPRIVRLELADHFPGLADDADGAIVGPYKEAVGACADARYLVALEELVGVLVRKGRPERHRRSRTTSTVGICQPDVKDGVRCVPARRHVPKWPSCRIETACCRGGAAAAWGNGAVGAPAAGDDDGGGLDSRLSSFRGGMANGRGASPTDASSWEPRHDEKPNTEI